MYAKELLLNIFMIIISKYLLFAPTAYAYVPEGA